MLITNRLSTGYDLQYDIISFALTKQLKRRKKSKYKISSSHKDRTNINIEHYYKKSKDKKYNKKLMRILNDRYIDIELNEYIEEKKELKHKNEARKQNVSIPFDNINDTNSSIYHHNINDSMISSQQKLKLSREANEERELLITGFCRYLIPKQINHDIFTSSIETYLRPLSCKTQRAIFSANFIAQIINNFQRENECPFIKKERDKINLLHYIYIRGGALRDIILHRDINDIDIVIDTNELTKRYDYHLKQYHSQIDTQSIHCTCYLWQRYIKMYKEPPYESSNFWEINAEQDPLKKFEINTVRCQFLLNAVFIKDIIIKSIYNKSTLESSIQAINTWGYTNWVLNINKSIKYKNIDLMGARFDIGDQMSLSDGMRKDIDGTIIDFGMMKQCKSWNKYFHFLFSLHSPFDGMRLMEKDRTSEEKEVMNELKQNYDNIEIFGGINNELISIYLPDYRFDMKYSTQFCDFTINGIRLPLSSIINDNNFNWYSKIMDYSYSNDVDNILYLGHNRMSIRNIENKIIKQPHLNVLSLQFVYNDYFWRFIKVLTKFAFYIYNGSWNIDRNTLSNIKKSFKLHFKSLDIPKIVEFLNRLFIWDISKETDIYEFERKISSRFIIFKIIDLEKYLIHAFKNNAYFGQYLGNYRVGRLGRDKLKIICKVLKEFGYELNRNNSFEIEESKPYQVPDSYRDPIYEMNYYQHVWLYYRVYTQIKEHEKRKTLKSNNYVKKKWNNNHNKRSPVQIKWKKKKKLKKKKSKRQEFNLFIKKGKFW